MVFSSTLPPLVKRNLRQGETWISTEDEASMACVTVDECIIIKGYCPPRENFIHSMAQLAATVVAQGRLHRHEHWLFVGDVNEPEDKREDSGLYRASTGAGGKPILATEATRWLGSRPIEWRISNCPNLFSQPKVKEVYVSDHKAISMEMQIARGARQRIGELKAKPKIEKPSSFTKAK